MSNAPPQAHPDWMLTATPKGWHYNRTQSGCALSSVYRDTIGWSGDFTHLKS
ncbi:MAG: hypothetical protein ABNH53_06250 [Henriciella sp.]